MRLILFNLLCIHLAVILVSVSGCTAQRPTGSSWENISQIVKSGDYPNVDAMLVWQNGEMLVESYYNGFRAKDKHQTRSSFKSITSLLAGIAIDQGLFSLDDEIGQYITEWQDDSRGKIRVKDLLEMRSGLACENFFDVGPDCESEMYDTDDWLGYILDIPVRYEPGFKWEYTSMEPELVGIIIDRTSGMRLFDFADKYLFGPLGITDCQWEITPDGRGYAAGSSRMLPSDMLKISQLVLSGGDWNGERIVSQEWIDSSTHCHIPVDMSFLYWSGIKGAKTTSAEYGYLWYRELLEYNGVQTEVLFASGNGGQYMMVIEEFNAALVFTGSNYGNWKGKLPFDLLVKYVIPELAKSK